MPDRAVALLLQEPPGPLVRVADDAVQRHAAVPGGARHQLSRPLFHQAEKPPSDAAAATLGVNIAGAAELREHAARPDVRISGDLSLRAGDQPGVGARIEARPLPVAQKVIGLRLRLAVFRPFALAHQPADAGEG